MEETVEISSKSRLAATLLAFFLGTLGIHRFYVGKTATAVAMLILGIIGYATIIVAVGVVLLWAVEIWALVDFVFAVSGIMKDKDGKVIKNW